MVTKLDILEKAIPLHAVSGSETLWGNFVIAVAAKKGTKPPEGSARASVAEAAVKFWQLQNSPALNHSKDISDMHETRAFLRLLVPGSFKLSTRSSRQLNGHNKLHHTPGHQRCRACGVRRFIGVLFRDQLPAVIESGHPFLV
jgi:hypothetical protein